jgi:hypothetical protein
MSPRRATTGDKEEGERGEGAEGKGPEEGAVELVGAEEAERGDDAPEDAAVEVDAGEGAGETVEGGGGADARDVGEHPVEDADLGEAADEGGGELEFEEKFGRDFHVDLAEFEVGGEFEALGGGYLSTG